jgi:sialic acid synthase SpsE
MKIIVDLFNQHSGDINELKRLALIAYQNGADVAKIQVLDTKRIWGDDSRKYLEINYDQFAEIADYSRNIGIEFLATIFNEDHLEWLDKLCVKK